MKTCNMCGESKGLSDFHRDSTRKGGYEYRCKTCKRGYDSNYRTENIENGRAHSVRYRAIKAGAVQGTHLPTMTELVTHYDAACLYPGCTNTDATLDHVIPLSRGGAHGLWNMQPLCKSHNSSKRNLNNTDYRTGSIWLESIPVVQPKSVSETVQIGYSSRWLA